MTAPAVTVIIPTIPPRQSMLQRAVASVAAQTVLVSLVIEEDKQRTGSAATRNRALAKVETETVLCLDDDDVLMPNAVQVLTEAREATGADVVSGGAWLTTPPHREPVKVPPPGWIAPETVTARSVLHVSSLIHTSLLREAGGFEFRRCPATNMLLDDYGAYCRLADAGARFWRVPETVLIWYLHGANTSGRGDRWLALVGPKLLGQRDHRRLDAPGPPLAFQPQDERVRVGQLRAHPVQFDHDRRLPPEGETVGQGGQVDPARQGGKRGLVFAHLPMIAYRRFAWLPSLPRLMGS